MFKQPQIQELKEIEIKEYEVTSKSKYIPEVVYINNIYTINKKEYTKLLIGLNLNSKFNHEVEFYKEHIVKKLNFKFMANINGFLNEIKPTLKIPENIVISQKQAKVFLEYQLPLDVFKKNKAVFNYSFSNLENDQSRNGKGEITINLINQESNNNIKQNLIFFYEEFDYSTKKTKTIKTILESNIEKICYPLDPNQRLKTFIDFNINYKRFNVAGLERNYELLNEISSIIENVYSNEVRINSFIVKGEGELKKYYDFKFAFGIENKDKKYKLVTTNKTNLVGQLVTEEPEAEMGIVINPFYKNQIFKFNLLINQIPVSFTFNSNEFKQPYFNYEKFAYKNYSIVRYKLTDEFWNQFSEIEKVENIEEYLKAYEI